MTNDQKERRKRLIKKCSLFLKENPELFQYSMEEAWRRQMDFFRNRPKFVIDRNG